MRCRELLISLAGAGLPVRLLPNVGAESMAALAAELLPEAELLSPIASELRYAALTLDSDVVVCADPREPFERRALIAAATGAAPLHLPAGPAAAVLGSALAVAPSADARAFRTALVAALEAAPQRAQRAAAVQDACGQERLAARLPELLERVVQSRSDRVTLP